MFQLDTSGRVACTDPAKPCVCHAATWGQLPPAARGYIRAIFTEGAGGEPGFGYAPNGDEAGFRHLVQEALADIMADLANLIPGCDEEAGAARWRDRQRGLNEKAPPLCPRMCSDGKVRLLTQQQAREADEADDEKMWTAANLKHGTI